MAAKKKSFKTLEEFKSVTPAILEKLTAKQLTIADVAAASKEYLMETLQQTEARIEKLIAEAKKNICFQFETMEMVLHRRAAIKKTGTGSKTLDQLLGGGIETQCILEVYGESTSGKTHLMHQLATCALRPIEEGGLDCAVVYLDTEGTFRPEKIQAIAQRMEVSSKALQNLVYIRIGNSIEQKLVLEKFLDDPNSVNEYIPEKLVKPVKVLIIDSIISHLRAEYSGRGMLAERQQLLNSILSKCLKFAHSYNALVLITNQVVNIPDAPAFAPTVKAAGGAILSHATTYRLYIRKGKGNTRIIKIIDAPNTGQDQILVSLTSRGIEDL